jgi:hypothetical protein
MPAFVPELLFPFAGKHGEMMAIRSPLPALVRGD